LNTPNPPLSTPLATIHTTTLLES